MSVFIVTGLILGLTSNFHCIGMCGPIALAVPVNRKNNATILLGALQYNIGRILIYAVLGAIVGSIGISIQTIGVLQWFSIISGALLILYAWKKYFTQLFNRQGSLLSIQPYLNKGLGKIVRSKSPLKLFMLGGLNGLLPCGMVFVALLNAILTGEIIGSALAMIAFGIGTLPSMIAVIFMANKITSSMRMKLNRAVPYMLTVVGLLIVLRGLNLGIPFISPSATVIHTESSENSKTPADIEMSCCHSAKECD